MIKIYFAKRILFVSIIGIFIVANLQAQQLGLANSNYAGTHGLYTNPSAIADSRHAFYLNLVFVNAGGSNNYFRYEAPVSLFKLFKDNLEFKEEYIKEDLDGKPKLVTAGADVRGPSFMLRLSPKHSVAFTSRVRGGVQINNLSEDIARLYKVQGGTAEDLVNQISDNNTINLNANVYSELGFSYARVLLDKQKHFVKGGFTIKKLAGGYSAYLINEDSQFKVEKRPVAGTDENDYVLKIDKIRAQYGYLTEDALGNGETSDYLKMLTGRNSPGQGWGADIGFTYEYRPNQDKYRSMLDGKEVLNQEKNKYKYRVGIALMDVGGINYNNPDYVRSYNLEKNNKELNLSDFDEAEGTEEYAEVINKALDVTDADKKMAFRSGLPTALNINLDYKIAGPLYVNATWIQGLRGKSAISMRQNSLVAVTPRLEFKKFEASFPVAIQNNYSVFTVGTMIRLGSLFIGSDNIGGAFNMGNPYGADVYAGFTLLPILKRNKKDKDKDGVSDGKDKCKKVPGTLELLGCPDKDNDGVADRDDSCPDVFGSVTLKGCPLPAVSVPVPTVDSITTPAIDSLAKPVTDSITVPATDSLRTPAADSLQIPAEKSLENTPPVNLPEPTPTNTTPATPATKPENGAESKSAYVRRFSNSL